MRPVAFLSLIALTLLAGCWLPDQYRADIEIAPNMVHTRFTGKVTDLDLYRQMRDRQGPKAAADNARDMDAMEKQLRQDPNIKSVKRAGLGTFQLAFAVDHPPRVPNEILSLLKFEPKGNRLVLHSPKYSAADAEFFRRNYSLKSSGDVCVTTSLKVIRHNADVPMGPNSRCYLWHLDLNNPRSVEIEVELPH